MTGLAAITLEGLLRAPFTGGPVPEGFNLYQALVTTYRIAVVLDDEDSEMAGMWLRKEGMRDFVMLHPQRPVDRDMLGYDRGTTLPPRVSQYRRLQALGGIELVVDPDPAAVAGAMDMGITAMVFGHPRNMRPEWRPDYEKVPRPWDELVAAVDSTRTLAVPIN